MVALIPSSIVLRNTYIKKDLCNLGLVQGNKQEN